MVSDNWVCGQWKVSEFDFILTNGNPVNGVFLAGKCLLSTESWLNTGND